MDLPTFDAPADAPHLDVTASAAPAVATRAMGRRELTRLFLVLLALTFVLRLPAFFVPVFNSDETFLATQAHVIEEGGQLYEEATDRKPPLVPYIYAGTFAFFGTTALWSVRLVAMLAVALTALLLAVEARRRWGPRRELDRRCALRAGDGRVRAQRRAGRELRGVHVAVDDGGNPVRAARGRGVAAGVAVAFATLAKQTGAATLLPVVYLLARGRGKRGVAAVAVGFAVPTADRRPDRRPRASSSTGPCSGNGSYLGVQTLSASVWVMFIAMTAAFVGCNLPLAVEAAACVARPCATRARRAGQHRPVAVARVGGGLGGGRPAVLRALLHPAAPAARAPHRRRACPRRRGKR